MKYYYKILEQGNIANALVDSRMIPDNKGAYTSSVAAMEAGEEAVILYFYNPNRVYVDTYEAPESASVTIQKAVDDAINRANVGRIGSDQYDIDHIN